jgi:hypothetical protein
MNPKPFKPCCNQHLADHDGACSKARSSASACPAVSSAVYTPNGKISLHGPFSFFGDGLQLLFFGVPTEPQNVTDPRCRGLKFSKFVSNLIFGDFEVWIFQAWIRFGFSHAWILLLARGAAAYVELVALFSGVISVVELAQFPLGPNQYNITSGP